METVGLEPGETIEVDGRLRVREHPWLFAIGDVNGRSLLTHMAKYQARVAAQVIAGGEARATRDDRGAPRVIFTDPQVAAVGLTLQGAQDRGINATAYDVATSETPGASFHGRNTPGTSRLVVDEDRAVIVGATFTGTEVAEWLQAATIAIVGEIPLVLLREAVPAFPTRSEVWLRLLERWSARKPSSLIANALEALGSEVGEPYPSEPLPPSRPDRLDGDGGAQFTGQQECVGLPASV